MNLIIFHVHIWKLDSCRFEVRSLGQVDGQRVKLSGHRVIEIITAELHMFSLI
jgi:hypothetical protein